MRITNTCPVSAKKAALYNAKFDAPKPQTVKTYIRIPGTKKIKQVTTYSTSSTSSTSSIIG